MGKELFRQLGVGRVRKLRLRSSLTAALPAERRVSARRGWAGEKSELLEQSADYRSLAQSA